MKQASIGPYRVIIVICHKLVETHHPRTDAIMLVSLCGHFRGAVRGIDIEPAFHHPRSIASGPAAEFQNPCASFQAIEECVQMSARLLSEVARVLRCVGTVKRECGRISGNPNLQLQYDQTALPRQWPAS